MRNRLLDAKRKDAETPERCLPLAKKFLVYTIEALNTKEIREWNAKDDCVNRLIDTIQYEMALCCAFLSCADTNPDLNVKLDNLKSAYDALEVVESMYISLMDVRWVHLTNKKYIGKTIREIRTSILNWLRFIKKKIRRKEQATSDSKPKN